MRDDLVPDPGGEAGEHTADLADEIAPGAVRQLPLWFPAPPPGTTTIAIDVPDKFRVTDVPIS